MATADDYRLAMENCVAKAELAKLQEIKDAWLNLRESYGLLLQAHIAEASLKSPLIGRRLDRTDITRRDGRTALASTIDRPFQAPSP